MGRLWPLWPLWPLRFRRGFDAVSTRFRRGFDAVSTPLHTHTLYVCMYRQSAVDVITLAFRPPGPYQYSAHVLLYVRTYCASGYTIQN